MSWNFSKSYFQSARSQKYEPKIRNSKLVVFFFHTEDLVWLFVFVVTWHTNELIRRNTLAKWRLHSLTSSHFYTYIYTPSIETVDDDDDDGDELLGK